MKLGCAVPSLSPPFYLVVNLLVDVSTAVVLAQGEQKQTAAVAGLLPLLAHQDFFLGVVVGRVREALVFDDQDSAVGELGDEVGVEVVGGRWQPERELNRTGFGGG